VPVSLRESVFIFIFYFNLKTKRKEFFMNIQNHSSSFITSPFTSFPEYQEFESHNCNDNPCFWLHSKDFEFNPCDDIKKVFTLISVIKEKIEKVRKEQLEVEDNAEPRELTIFQAANQVISQYQENSNSLFNKLSSIVSKVEKVKMDLPIAEEIKALTTEITSFYDKIKCIESQIKAQPIAQDQRSQKKSTRHFVVKVDILPNGMNYYPPQEYQVGSILNQFSDTDCWKWIGKREGFKMVKGELILIANQLHATERCFRDFEKVVKTTSLLFSFTVLAGALSWSGRDVKPLNDNKDKKD
jgi:hypothetical protein